jgi:pimeloyl-ACP methyl ester carboxylesterase
MTDAIKLHTTTRGEGPTVLFVHGLDDDGTLWERAVDLLADDHRCVSVDLPGHGSSPVSDDPRVYERDAVLDAIDAVLAGLDAPVVLVGHSLGGYLGLAHVLTRPGALASLVLVATGPGFRDPVARESWNERVAANAPDYGISETAARIAFHVDSMVIDHLTEIEIPVALVVGSRDKGFLGANDYFEKKLPQAIRTTVDDGGHKVMRSHPEVIAEAVRSMVAATAG